MAFGTRVGAASAGIPVGVWTAMWKCTAYWMRREGKRVGRKIPYESYEYTLAAQMGRMGRARKMRRSRRRMRMVDG